ncbi:MAG: TerB family tellurite resistance protein [Pelagibacterales bacterium]|nr:TerB family tellurite resistance protein [Pelagibacterales bacterium]
MFNFFKKKNKEVIENSLVKIAALLIHVAKIDENYTQKEREIIKKAIMKLSSKNEIIDNVLIKAEKIEKNSNQILDFTREVKNMNEDSKIKIVEVLWSIIYSDTNADVYENNLMRRLTGLLYLDPKIVGNIKKKVINNLK